MQHSLARLAGKAAAATAAAGSAADALAHARAFDDAIFLEVASTKIRAAEAAQEGAAIAYQIHGARNDRSGPRRWAVGGRLRQSSR